METHITIAPEAHSSSRRTSSIPPKWAWTTKHGAGLRAAPCFVVCDQPTGIPSPTSS